MQSNKAIDLVQLRLLQQGRGTCSDGKDWLRMVIGVAVTVLISMLTLYFEAPVFCFVTLIVGLVATVEWIVQAGRTAGKHLEADLNSRLQIS